MDEDITAMGNPGGLDFVLMRGYIAGGVRPIDGMWKEAIIVGVAGTRGLSGGPMFDESDNVVGLVAGMQVAPMEGPLPDGTQTGLMMAVPASTICMLLGRDVANAARVSAVTQ